MPDETPDLTSHDLRRYLILHPDGRIESVGGIQETTVLHADGTTDFTQTTMAIRTLDQVVIHEPSEARTYYCATCGQGPYSSRAIITCANPACGRIVCRSCFAEHPTGALCKPCAKAVARKEFFSWLFHNIA